MKYGRKVTITNNKKLKPENKENLKSSISIHLIRTCLKGIYSSPNYQHQH